MLLAVNKNNSVAQLFTLIIIFALVLALTYFSTKFIANYQKGKISGANIILMEAARLSGNKYLQIVKIGEKYFCLAVCKDSVSVVCQVDEGELKSNNTDLGKMDFSGILDRFKRNESASEKGPDENTLENNEEIQKQEKHN